MLFRSQVDMVLALLRLFRVLHSAVDIDSLENTPLELSHQALNDKSCEGVRHTQYPCFSVQFHPEASAGPEDARDLFDEFINMMDKEGHHA